MKTRGKYEDLEITPKHMELLANLVKSHMPENFGFIIMACPYGDSGRLRYASTMDRKGVINLLKEFLIDCSSMEGWAKDL